MCSFARADYETGNRHHNRTGDYFANHRDVRAKGAEVKIVAIMPVRNEDWIIGLSARALLRWVDELIILDHCSTDESRELEWSVALEHPERVITLTDNDPIWHEMAHRQRMLESARGRGATHIVTVDADEVVSGNLVKHMRLIVEDMPPGMVLQLPWICLRDSIDQCHRTGLWAEQFASAAFVDNPACFWGQRNGYDFHQRAPMGRPEVAFKPVAHAFGGILHLQYSSRRRLLAKQALYKMTEAIRWPERKFGVVNQTYNWSVYGRAESKQAQFDLGPIPSDWWAGYEDLMGYLHVDAEPWQEAECRKLVKEYGRDKFNGLDLFGVV